MAMARIPDIALLEAAMATSTLNHGLRLLGDRWTIQVLMGAFTGIRHFEEWHDRLAIPRPTLAEKLRRLVEIEVLRPRPHPHHAGRQAYHLTRKGLALYPAVLMVWDWEHRFGERQEALPRRLVHTRCGQGFLPELACGACGEPVTMRDLRYRLRPNPRLAPTEDAGPAARTPRLPPGSGNAVGLGLRLDRWALLIISAASLGCRHFDEFSRVLGIGPSVLSRRLSDMVDTGLLHATADRGDARRRIYLLTPASRAMFGYIVCFTAWASEEHFGETESIRPVHLSCGKPFVPVVACGHCHETLEAREVRYEMPGQAAT